MGKGALGAIRKGGTKHETATTSSVSDNHVYGNYSQYEVRYGDAAYPSNANVRKRLRLRHGIRTYQLPGIHSWVVARPQKVLAACIV